MIYKKLERISGRRFKRVKKDLADFGMMIINNHLYRTKRTTNG